MHRTLCHILALAWVRISPIFSGGTASLFVVTLGALTIGGGTEVDVEASLFWLTTAGRRRTGGGAFVTEVSVLAWVLPVVIIQRFA